MSEFVDKAMELADAVADSAWDAGAAGLFDRLWERHAKQRDVKRAALRAHLEAREAEAQLWVDLTYASQAERDAARQERDKERARVEVLEAALKYARRFLNAADHDVAFVDAALTQSKEQA
jgi:hypothetical protein